MTAPIMYRGLEPILNVLHNYKTDNAQAIGHLLQVFEKAKSLVGKAVKKHPLIVFEGLDGCGKSTLSYKLAKHYGATLWCTPPKSIKNIRHFFDEHNELRLAYYALGNYIAAMEVEVILQESPVFMDRYWHSTAGFALAQAIHDFPDQVTLLPEGDVFYQWPSDLLKPDIVIFLEVSEEQRIQRLSRRTESTSQENLLKTSKKLRDNISTIYKNMVNPEVTFVNSDYCINATMKNIQAKIQHLF